MKNLTFVILNILITSSVMAEDCLREGELLSTTKIDVERVSEIGQCFFYADEFDDAENWLLRSSKEGSRAAQERLGFLYHRGLGNVKQDFTKALYWYGEASNQEDGGYASHGLALMYKFAEGVEQDSEKVVFYLKRSAKQGYAWGQYHLAVEYDTSKRGVDRVLPADPENAFKWYLTAAENGVTESKRRVASLYSYGWGVDTDRKKAYSWYVSAAEDGDAAAQNSLAIWLESGTDVPMDLKQAAEWYTKSALQGNKDAMTSLAYLYLKGQGVQKDKDKAVEWFKKAGKSWLEIKLITSKK